VTGEIVSSYLELGLRLGRHVEGLVDSYYGPAELKQRVDTEELHDPGALASTAAALRESLGEAGFAQSRERWLRAQLVGLETVARKVAGEEISYEQEVERCYGVRPQRAPEEQFEAARGALDEALPGGGALAERYQAWREENAIQDDAVGRVIDGLAADLRDRTRALFGLPEGEGVELEYVSDEPWAAYNYYLGGLRSRIAFNVDRPHTPYFVAVTVPHETYPGHHAEHAWKEQVLVRERGQAEESIILIGTPQNMISEGIAVLGLEILVGDEEENLMASHLAGAGVDYDPELARAIKRARAPLERVQGNAALMLHAEGGTEDEAHAYLMRWGLASPQRASHQLQFILDPIWRAYVTTYADGYQLCSDFVQGDPLRFKQLLTEQLTPADLV